jgi:cytochrome P450
MITEVVRSRLAPVVERLRDGETVEAISELTRGIPTEVIARMLGVQPDMVAKFSTWSDAMGAAAEGYSSPGERGAGLIAAGKQATAELNEYLRGQITQRRCPAGAPEPDLISTMVRHDYACGHMTEQEIVASNTQLVFAGNETTAKLLGHFLVTLAAHPDQWAAIRADPDLIPGAVEEVHRYETISHSIFRDAIGSEATVGGHRIPGDVRITLLLAAANRDPRRWDRPHAFDVQRKKLPHLGFAFGSHSCLGMNLARLEAWIFAEELVAALPHWHVQTPVDYGTNYTVRGPQSVWLTTD